MKLYIEKPIPKCCGECPYSRTVKHICFFTGKLSMLPWTERPEYCPIIEEPENDF